MQNRLMTRLIIILSISACVFLLAKKFDVFGETKLNKDHKFHIVAVGDSLTAGYGVAEGESYPALLKNRLLQEGYDFELTNMGMSGATSGEALAAIPEILAQNPDIVLLEIGINDVIQGRSFDDVQENVFQILSALQEKNITTMLIGMRVNPAISSTYYDEFNDIYPELAEKFSLELMPYFLQDVARKRGLNLVDGMHPNAKGYEIIVANLYGHVLKVIEDWQGAQG
ncbi:MAG: arylesterase [Desulfotalea sp.]